MTEKTRVDVPNLAIDLGEKVQDWSVIRGLRRTLMDSKSSAFKRAKWGSVEDIIDVDGQPFRLPIAEGDREANIVHAVFRRLMTKAVVVGANVLALAEARKINYRHGGEAAVAFTYKGRTRAGILPNGINDLGPPQDGCWLNTAALREGPNDFGAGLGIYIPGERILIAPREQLIVEQHLPIDKLTERYPGTPLV